LHPIPYRDGEVPERLVYRPDVRELHLADGVIAPVTEAAFDFRVGDIRTVEKWFRCRQRHPRGRRSSELDDVVNERWTAQLTVDLLNLLNVLEGLVALEGSQRALLRCVIASKLIARSDLVKMGVLPVPDSRRHPRKGASSNALF
jgi:hypothetical protein